MVTEGIAGNAGSENPALFMTGAIPQVGGESSVWFRVNYKSADPDWAASVGTAAYGYATMFDDFKIFETV